MSSFNKSKKNILFVSTNRADYGLINNVYKKFKRYKYFETKLITTEKLKFLENIGNSFNVKIKEFKNIESINPKNISLYINKFHQLFQSYKPDLLFILGDRYETLGIAISAFYNFIKIAHISGGEETEGSMDNINRHLITKLSNIHFVYFNEYKKRIIQLGENVNHIKICHPLILDSLKNNYFSKKQIEKKFGLKFSKINCLVTFHPITNNPKKNIEYLKTLLNAISKFKNINFIFTSSNHDGGGDRFNIIINEYCKKNNTNSIFIKNFGHKYYLSCLKIVNFVLGNSSSGVIEAPLIGTPSINLGNRQKGRVILKGVFNIDINEKAIVKKINQIIKVKKRQAIQKKISPSEIILKYTKKILNEKSIQHPKVFNDIL